MPYPLALEHKIRTAFGSDLLFSSELAARQGVMLTHLKRWYDNVDILRMATSVNGELLALSGPRNPYPGKLGVVEKARWPTSSSSTATRSPTSRFSKSRIQALQ